IQLHGPLVMFGQALGWPDMTSSFYHTGVHMEATCLQLADSVYTSSLCSAEWVISGYKLNKPEIPVIHLGIDTTLFSPKKHLQNQHPTLVFVGKLVKNKGIEELVEAAITLREEFPALEVYLVGRGDASIVSNLKERSKGVENLLNFMGPVAKEQLPAILSRAHVFTAPSWYEGGPGFVYLEAMACGLPVIGCSGSGVGEIIQHRETGLLVPPRDTQALTEAIRTLLRDTLTRQQLGEKARQYVVEEADHERCLDKLEAYYEKVCTEKAQNA
ncbi:MAG: glycosyltransferase family 4 protein, partial [Bacteroidetes bacterium]|nr:glycosyltransferase family 4 protein [Bacteroidota bacterium]